MKRFSILLLSLVLLLGGGYYGFQFFKIELKARAAQVLLQYAWHKTIKTGEKQRPWKSFDGTPILRLTIPQHEVDQIVLSGTSSQALAFGPSFHEESFLPHERKTTIVSSHRDTHGSYIRKLILGEVIRIQDQYNNWHSYAIDDFFILNVNEKQLSIDSTEQRFYW